MTSDSDDRKEPGQSVHQDIDPDPNNPASQVRGPLGILMPADYSIWSQSRRMVIDKSVRVADFATCAAQDPIIVIELLRISNAMYFAGGRSPITSLNTAIVRLGSDVMMECLQKLSERPTIENKEVSHWFELYRARGKRTSIVARILAEVVARNLNDDLQAIGVLSSIGEMLAVINFGEEYVNLAERHSRSGVNYQLSQKHHFEVEKMGLRYLRKSGIPEALLFAIDREAKSRTPDRAIMRPVCFAALELVDAFDANRWEKLAPGKNLPPKSSVRMLQMGDGQYLKVYERVAEYLFAARMEEEKKEREQYQIEEGEAGIDFPDDIDFEEDNLNQDIENLLKGTVDDQESATQELEEVADKKTQENVNPVPQAFQETVEQFSLQSTVEKKTPRVVEDIPVQIAPPQLRTRHGNAVVSSVAAMLDDANSSEELLTSLLDRLITDGPFEKSALIVVSKNREQAIVVAARGPNIGNGQKLVLDDPLSPLAQCFSKVQSYGNRSNKVSPFGSRAFALAPIDADHDTPVALYADCGVNGSLTFEARRVFRTIVDILNQKLPTIPGGIPVELESL